MDIVITIPKKEIRNFKREVQQMRDHDLTKRYKVSNIPTMLDPGDTIFFLLDGEVCYKGEFIQSVKSSMFSCQTTRRDWSGLFLECAEIIECDEPERIKQRGFQGFRYTWWGS